MVGVSDVPYVATWDHTSGALGDETGLSFGDYEFSISGLDTLNDGTTVTLV